VIVQQVQPQPPLSFEACFVKSRCDLQLKKQGDKTMYAYVDDEAAAGVDADAVDAEEEEDSKWVTLRSRTLGRRATISFGGVKKGIPYRAWSVGNRLSDFFTNLRAAARSPALSFSSASSQHRCASSLLDSCRV